MKYKSLVALSAALLLCTAGASVAQDSLDSLSSPSGMGDDCTFPDTLGDDVTANELSIIRSATNLTVIPLSGCEDSESVSGAVESAIFGNPALADQLAQQGVGGGEILGVSASPGMVTVYVAEDDLDDLIPQPPPPPPPDGTPPHDGTPPSDGNPPPDGAPPNGNPPPAGSPPPNGPPAAGDPPPNSPPPPAAGKR